MKASVDLYTDGALVYVMIRGLRYAIGPLVSFGQDHPKIFDKMMQELRKQKYLV